jgi:hypothetical protein
VLQLLLVVGDVLLKVVPKFVQTAFESLLGSFELFQHFVDFFLLASALLALPVLLHFLLVLPEDLLEIFGFVAEVGDLLVVLLRC